MLGAALSVQRWVKGLYFGWWVLSGTIAFQILTSVFLMQSYGAYVAVMEKEFSWSKTTFAVAFAVQQAGGGVIGPFQGWLLQRLGPQLVIRLGLGFLAGGLMALSQVTNLLSFYLAILLLALGGSLAGFLSTNTVAVYWFQRWRSTALALLQTGISIGGLLVPLVAWSLATHGWRSTAFASGLLALFIGLPLTFLIQNQPEDRGLLPDGAHHPPQRRPGENGTPTEAPQRDFSAYEALRTRAFWLIGFGHALALTVVFAVVNHLVLHLTTDLGFSLQRAAAMVALMTSFAIAGQLLGGLLGDYFDKRILATAAMAGHATALLCLAFGTTQLWVVAFCVVHGLAWGLRGPIMQSLRADYFGRAAFAQIMGFSIAIVTLGIVTGPILAGALADQTGSYRLAFTILAGLAILGSGFFLFATKPVPPAAGSEAT
ncbi:MAG: MFS transporter [Trueperaceae bacterium]|nr:MAG: MFS transporter [Trueperaceae bacterium]